MGKRKVTILEPAVEEVARIALFIEGEGLPKTAKKFVDDAFAFFAPSQMIVLSIVLASIRLPGERTWITPLLRREREFHRACFATASTRRMSNPIEDLILNFSGQDDRSFDLACGD